MKNKNKSIRTSLNSENRPKRVVTDYKGSPLLDGRRVAFNYQGAVVLGTIKELKKTQWKKIRNGSWWSLTFLLEVENDMTGTISKIKNPNSVVVID